jgi:4-aminobutyrate aminotransferase-like enzyme
LAVLEVIEKENLQQNALQVGQYLEERLVEMQAQDPRIGPLHGCGLFRGLEVVKEDGAPDGERAARIKNHLREHGVLLGSTGPHGHVLKIRPPVVFQREHADILLAALRPAFENCI